MARTSLTRKLQSSLFSDSGGRPHPVAGSRAPAQLDDVGFRQWLCETLDRVVLAMAVAGFQDDPAMLDPRYAEGMVQVFDDYLGRRPPRRKHHRRIVHTSRCSVR
jgi:hypothetical protein